MMDIVVETGHGNPSSNPEHGCFTSANTFGKGIYRAIFPAAIGKIVRKTWISSLSIATSLGEL